MELRLRDADCEYFGEDVGMATPIELLELVRSRLAEARAKAHVEPCYRIGRVRNLAFFAMYTNDTRALQTIDIGKHLFFVVQRIDYIECLPQDFVEIRADAIYVRIVGNQRLSCRRSDPT